MVVEPRGLPRLQDLPPNTFFLDDSNTSLIKYTVPFTTSQNNTCAGGTCTLLGSATGSLEFNFTGTDVWLFGKPGGLTRVFLDNQLNEVVDTSSLPNNGSALWAVTGLTQGVHTIKLGGLDGDGLNLLIDFFGVNGVVSATSIATDTNYLSPGQLTTIIVGSLVGFFVLLAVIGISILVYVRRKRRRRISKSGIKLISIDGAAASGGRRSTSRVGLLSGFLPGRFSTEKRPQADMASDGYGGRVSNSTDGGNIFPKSQYASMNSDTVPSAYSPPTSADASVPLFAQPLSQSHNRQLTFIPESTVATSHSSLPSPPLQQPPQPLLEQQRQQQLQQLRQLRLLNQTPAHLVKNEPSNNGLELERTSLMEAPPPGYQRDPPQPVHQDPTSRYRPPETINPAEYKTTNLPARGAGDSRVAMASFSTAPTPSTTNTMQIPQIYMATPQNYTPGPQPSTRQAQNSIPDAPEGPPQQSFKPLGTHSDKLAGPVPPPPTNMPSRSPQVSPGKSLKGPRPRGGSNAQPMWASAAGETQGFGARPPAVTGPGNMRPEDEEPESPIDPAVNVRSHWY